MANDGEIKIGITVDGKQVNVASKELDNLGNAGRKAGDGVEQTEEGVRGAGNESQKATGKVKKFVTALGLVAIGAAAFQTLRASMDDAIKRFDILNNYPRVLQSLGVDAEDSKRSINELSDGIDGLPTKLDDIASTAQRMYTSFGDIDKATDSALALNNALLANGSSAADAQRGTEQYLQMLQTGKVDMEQWRTLQETMDVSLNKVANSFGFAGRSATNDFYKALQSEQITIDQFNDKLIELGTGTGELAELARTNSQGIATSFGNLRYAAARGITTVIESLDQLSKDVTGNNIAENIDKMKVVVTASFDAIARAIELSTPVVKAFATGIGALIDVMEPLTPVIVGATTAFVGFMIVSKLNSALQITTRVTKLSSAAFGLMTGRITAATVATKALAAAKTLLRGPVGWVTAGVGALVGATVGLVKWLNRSSEEAEQLKNDTEELSKETDDLKSSIEQSTDSYQENQKEIEANSKANQDLMRRIDELARKENKSAAEKQMLAKYTEQANESIEGLNLAYDAEADALNMSSKELQARIDLQNEEAKGMAAQERLMEIEKERMSVNEQLAEINELRAEANELMKNGGKDARDAKDALTDLDEQEKELKGTLETLNEQYVETEGQVKTSAENMAAAIEQGNLRQINSYEDLDEEQKKAFDNMMSRYESLRDAATDSFERIRDESKVSADEMIENLEHNQRMTEKWGENQAALMEWASEKGYEGFMRHIDQLGIDQAAELDVIANMTDEQLEEYAGLMERGSKKSLDAFNAAAGEGFDHFIDLLEKEAGISASTLRRALKGAGFDDMGEDIPDELKDGVNSGSSSLMRTLRGMASDLTSPFGGIIGRFSGIGANIISGIRSGINANSWRLNSTVASVADNVTSTMRYRLQIRSPSRRMRDKIGKFIPEGIAVGIEANADSVYRELDKLSNNMMRVSTPEMALETHRMAYSSGGFQTPQISSSPTSKPYNVLNQRQEKPANINIVFPGRTFRAFVQDIFDERDIQTRLEEGF
uniref:tape measure protein n=1 Tax=uncultured Allobacillus sp. TaxID=1638025 RepID=UPI0025937DAF|nr:tape measure protein [uncultured Allobacillus sp.]